MLWVKERIIFFPGGFFKKRYLVEGYNTCDKSGCNVDIRAAAWFGRSICIG
jgi:hypothetical protein